MTINEVNRLTKSTCQLRGYVYIENNFSSSADTPDVSWLRHDGRHIYVSDRSNIIECSVPFYAISDHYSVCVTWKKSYTKNRKSTNKITYRRTKHLNETQLITDLLNSPLNCPHSNFVDPDEALQACHRAFNSCLR